MFQSIQGYAFFCFLVLTAIPSNAQRTSQRAEPELHSLSSNALMISVDPKAGGRIVSLQLDSKEILISKNVETKYYGSTLWLAPESKWWPINLALDTSSFVVVKKKSNFIHLKSTLANIGVQVEKKIRILPMDTAVEVQYIIRNTSPEIKTVGAWELIRVNGGASFFPYDESKPSLPSQLQNVEFKDSIARYVFDKNMIMQPEKLYATGKEGWIAHEGNGLLFIKSYPDLRTDQIFSEHGEVEIYVNEKATYVELETHGECTQLKPYEYTSYRVKWFVRKLPIFKEDQKRKEVANYVRGIIHPSR